MQQVLALQERNAGGFNGNIGCKRAALRLPALGAVANLNWCQWSGDGKTDASAEARTKVGAHAFLVLSDEALVVLAQRAPPARRQAWAGLVKSATYSDTGSGGLPLALRLSGTRRDFPLPGDGISVPGWASHVSLKPMFEGVFPCARLHESVSIWPSG